MPLPEHRVGQAFQPDTGCQAGKPDLLLEHNRNQDKGEPSAQPSGVELPPTLRADLLDPVNWQEGLATFARATKLAVALADAAGRLIGSIINPRPTWSLLQAKTPPGIRSQGSGVRDQESADRSDIPHLTPDSCLLTPGGCPFSLAPLSPCNCVADALARGGLVVARDRTGLVHFAVPLVLGGQPLGALVAGQVFDQYAEQLPLEQVARQLGLSPAAAWQLARLEHPVKRATLEVYADLLATLGQTFLQTRYHTITEANRLAEMTRLRDLAMTERQRAEETVLEKEVLLKEIHHRVKNNLQVISSLLHLQSRSVQDAPTRALLLESQQRVQAMALIHDKLYQSHDFNRAGFAAFVRSLAAELFQAYQAQPDAIRLKTGVDDLPLTVDQAIPCGLILNELLSNCFKHAFPSGRQGEIRIEFRLETPGGYLLTVADDGVGFPSQVDFHTTSSLGLRLVRTLTNQLHGTIDCHCDGVAKFELRFPQGHPPAPTIRPEAPIGPSTTPDGCTAHQEEAGSNLTGPHP